MINVKDIDYVSIAGVTQEWFCESSLNDNQIVVNLTSGTGAMTAFSN